MLSSSLSREDRRVAASHPTIGNIRSDVAVKSLATTRESKRSRLIWGVIGFIMAPSPNNDDRTLGVLHDPLADRTEQESGDTSSTPRSDHHHVCLL